MISASKLEVDSCETWTSTYYDLDSQSLVFEEGPNLLPQTLTIELLDSLWYVTNSEYFDPPHFCSGSGATSPTPTPVAPAIPVAPVPTPVPSMFVDGVPIMEFATDLLRRGAEAESNSLYTLDSAYVAAVYAGAAYDLISGHVTTIDDLSWYELADLDYGSWFVVDARRISDTKIEVDDCEAWSNTHYELATGDLIDSFDSELVPHTFTIERLGADWFITEVDHHDAPGFCSG